MYTKSLIQQKLEAIQVKENFRVAIENLMEKYNIEDSIFVIQGNIIKEATNGYFNVESEYDSLDKAVSECDVTTMGIRVMNNKKFQTGKLYKTISECDNNKSVFDIDRLETIC